MKKNKKIITLIVHDLSSNPIVRAYPIALALERIGYNVEIVGFLIEKNKVYQPYADKFDYKTVYIGKGGLLNYLKGLPKLLKLIKGDIIYAFKPRMTSFFVGLLKSRFGLKNELILDAEDDELSFTYKNKIHFIYFFFIRGWNDPNAHLKLLLLHLFLFSAKKRTVVSSKLQKRYGGEIILHGPDEKIFDPELFDQVQSRKQFNLPLDKTLILFAGVPHDHKGVNTIINVLKNLKEDFVFVGAGPPDHKLFVKAKEILKEKCIILGIVDNSRMASLLASVDITPMLQKKTKFTDSQMPAKLFEAMAMKKTIIATDASDIGKILGKEEKEKRGFLIDFDNEAQFKEKLIFIKNNKEIIERMQENARAFFKSEACVEAISLKLEKLLNNSSI